MMGNTTSRAKICSDISKIHRNQPIKGKLLSPDQEPVEITESAEAKSISPCQMKYEGNVSKGDQQPHTSMDSGCLSTNISSKSQIDAFKNQMLLRPPGNPCDCAMREEFLTSAAVCAVRCMQTDVSDDLLWAAFKNVCSNRNEATKLLLSQKLLESLMRLDSSNDREGDEANSTTCACSSSHQPRLTDASEKLTRKARKAESESDTGAAHSPDITSVLEKGRVDTQDSEAYLAQFPVERESCLEEPSEFLTEVQPLPVTIDSKTDLLQSEIERKTFHNATTSRYKVLLAENERLKRRQLCRHCKVHTVNATLLPCGHFVYCLDCAQTLERCGVCDKEILGDVRTFLS